MNSRELSVSVNGKDYTRRVTPRMSLSDFLRDELRLTGTHIGCEQGVCGACTVLVDGEATRACLLLAVQTHGRAVTTVEGLAGEGELGPLQEAFRRQHALQCGFCTPGFLLSATNLLRDRPPADEREAREALCGNLCRCTGYAGIVRAVCEVAGGKSSCGETAGDGTIGSRTRRTEDERFLRGEGRYTSDISLPGMARAVMLRSPHARARIVSVEVSAARTAPGVLAVLTPDDIADIGPFPQVQPHPSLDSRTPLPLARGVVRYAGEPVAMVVAEDAYLAEDALDLIEVVYEPLAPAVDPERALAEGAPLVHEDVPGNLAGRLYQQVGDVEAQLERADVVVTERLSVGRVSGQAMETRAVTAQFEGGMLTVWMTTQSPHLSRAIIAGQVGLPPERVHVIAPDIGGGFGPKNRHYHEYSLVPLMAIRLGRPVSWVEDRRESFTATFHGREQVHEVTLGLSSDGKILALRDRFIYDQGAYSPIGVVVPYVTLVSIPGPYRVPSYEVECRMVYTNKTPGSPYRGAGKPQAAYVIERMMDAAAARLGLDPVELRRRNLLRPEEFPYRTGIIDMDATEVTYDSGDYHAALERALELVGYDEFPRRRAEARRRGRHIGLGVACYATMTGRGPFEGARVRLAPDGRVEVFAGVSTQGQGHQTALAQICADQLGCRFEDVTVRTGDTDFIEKSIGTYAARVVVMAGNAVAAAARQLKEKILPAAADALGTAAGLLDIEGASVVTRGGGPSVTLAALAERFGASLPDETFFFRSQRPAYAAGTYAVVVEVDPETCKVDVLEHLLVHDCGVMVNPQLVEGQIYGGVTQGLSEMLMEEFKYDEEGRPLNASFRDYLLPTAASVPPLRIEHLSTPSPFNPLGVKGAGEGGTVPVAPAISSAIEDALGRSVRLRRRPVHPPELWRLVTTGEGL
jgi:aerobic carbon-monoxide dehydrogenase large subunit